MIENRNLLGGTRLVARFKKQAYVCTVEAGEGGEGVAFVLEDGKRFKSPSAAGTAITGGAINGWRFWSLEGDEPKDGEKTTTATKAPRTRGKADSAQTKPKAERKPRAPKSSKLIYRVPSQKKDAADTARFFCTACMASFVVDAGQTPAACPEGHSEAALAEFAQDMLEDAMAAAEEALDAPREDAAGEANE